MDLHFDPSALNLVIVVAISVVFLIVVLCLLYCNSRRRRVIVIDSGVPTLGWINVLLAVDDEDDLKWTRQQLGRACTSDVTSLSFIFVSEAPRIRIRPIRQPFCLLICLRRRRGMFSRDDLRELVDMAAFVIVIVRFGIGEPGEIVCPSYLQVMPRQWTHVLLMSCRLDLHAMQLMVLENALTNLPNVFDFVRRNRATWHSDIVEFLTQDRS